MTTGELAGKLCGDIVVGVFRRGDRSFIATRFMYPVGDSVNVYLADDGDQLRVTDSGMTHYFLGVDGTDLTDRRREVVRSICALYDVEYGQDFVLRKTITPSTVGTDVLAFCEAITRVSSLHYQVQPHPRSGLVREVESLLENRVKIIRPYETGWFDATVHGGQSYPVDYHFNSVGEPKNLYLIGHALKAERVIGTIHFWESRGRGAPSIAVLAPDLKLTHKLTKKLLLTSKFEHGVMGNEDVIVDFVTRKTPRQ